MELLYQAFSGRLLADYGIIYDQCGVRPELKLELRQHKGYPPQLVFKWTHRRVVEATAIDAATEILDRLSSVIRDTREKVRTLPSSVGPPMSVFRELVATLFRKDKVIVDYGMIQEQESWRPRVSISLCQVEGRNPRLVLVWRARARSLNYNAIELIADTLQKIQDVVEDIRKRVTTLPTTQPAVGAEGKGPAAQSHRWSRGEGANSW